MGRPITHFDGKSYNQRAADKLVGLGGKKFGMNMNRVTVGQLEELRELLPNMTRSEIVEYAISGLLRDLRVVDSHEIGDTMDERFADKEAYVA